MLTSIIASTLYQINAISTPLSSYLLINYYGPAVLHVCLRAFSIYDILSYGYFLLFFYILSLLLWIRWSVRVQSTHLISENNSQVFSMAIFVGYYPLESRTVDIVSSFFRYSDAASNFGASTISKQINQQNVRPNMSGKRQQYAYRAI